MLKMSHAILLQLITIMSTLIMIIMKISSALPWFSELVNNYTDDDRQNHSNNTCSNSNLNKWIIVKTFAGSCAPLRLLPFIISCVESRQKRMILSFLHVAVWNVEFQQHLFNFIVDIGNDRRHNSLLFLKYLLMFASANVTANNVSKYAGTFQYKR